MSLQSAEISDINITHPAEANAGTVQAPRFPKAVFVIRTAWRRLVTSMTFVPDRK
jgi:hypothetical protein